MKIERIQLSSDFLANLGYKDFVSDITHFEILQNFQYDQNNFFSLVKVVFKPDALSRWEQVMKTKMGVDSIQLLKKSGNSVMCILKSKSEAGFWPKLEPGPWAIIPPISIDAESIVLTLISDEPFLELLYNMISKHATSFKILAINDMTEDLNGHTSKSPNFTDRQREITKYAVRMGYYNSPKRISAESIAGYFGISVSAMNEHLRKAERQAMEYFFS
jgi:predicted DNA binding protein